MITHYVVSFDHNKNEWSVDDEGTIAFIGSLMRNNALTWVDDEVDWVRLSEAEMVLLRSDLAWRLGRKDYLND